MSRRRDWRDGNERGEREELRTPEPGKRAIAGLRPRRSIPEYPGKRTVTQDLPPASAAITVGRALTAVREQLPQLATALRTADFEMAAVAAGVVRAQLGEAHRATTAAPSDAEEDLVALEREAEPLLATAPTLSDQAYRERFYSVGRPRPAWDAEKRAWLAGMGASASSSMQRPTEKAPAPISGESRLTSDVGAHMEGSFGTDFSAVRAHQDGRTEAHGAQHIDRSAEAGAIPHRPDEVLARLDEIRGGEHESERAL